MKIVIDIDENVLTRLFDNGMEDYAIVNDDLFAIAKAIRKSTPLEKAIEDIKAEIETDLSMFCFDDWGNENGSWTAIKEIIDRHIAERRTE